MAEVKKQTSSKISSIAAKYMFDDNPEIRRMSASLLSQDETAGQDDAAVARKRLAEIEENPGSLVRGEKLSKRLKKLGQPVDQPTPKTVPHQKLDPMPPEADQPNVNKVSKRSWKRWSGKAQRTFNSVFAWVYANQSLMVHPKMKHAAVEQWKAIAWNAAYIAADHVDGKMWSESTLALRSAAYSTMETRIAPCPRPPSV